MLWLLKLINPLKGIASEIARVQIERAKAETDETKIEADLRIEQLRAREAVLIKGGRMTPLVQFLWAAPFVIYNAKVIVWDKVLASWTGGVTDPLGAFEINLGYMIAGFYFLTTGIKTVRRVW